ncbi:putative nuclease HARBI1 [Diadema antillarum]|uniref:putative nuclease HARBI1 n=1 Tax=Diadema antillarum TaxID=105358 RepID=UPI003A8B7A90
MPNCVGCIDCTHIYLRAPNNNAQVYINRKGRASINPQAIVDADLRFVNVVARWPGSTHDAFIWENSHVCQDFRNGRFPSGWLLGDSGYGLQPWLLTPILRPQSAAEERYNNSLTSTRTCVERAFGLLKARFRCLDRSGGVLCYSPERVCKIILSCCVLHNMCVNRQLPLPDGLVVQPHDPDQHEQPVAHHHGGGDARNRVIQTFFS